MRIFVGEQRVTDAGETNYEMFDVNSLLVDEPENDYDVTPQTSKSPAVISGGTKSDSVKNAVKQEPITSARSPAVIKYHNNAKSSSAGADTCKAVNYEMQKRHLEHEILKTKQSLNRKGVTNRQSLKKVKI